MIINIVRISKEAEADYLDIFEIEMDEKISKSIIEEVFIYIKIKNINEKKFKVKYFDEEKNRMLMLFVLKHCEQTSSIINIVKWCIRGICFESKIIDELEEEGMIEIWLKSFLL